MNTPRSAPAETPTDPPALLAPPEVPAALPDIPGGEPNLLRVESLNAALRVLIPMWQNSLPQPDYPERLWFYWNDQLVEEKEWTSPVAPADLVLLVPDLHRQEGTHRLRYTVMTFNQEEVGSEEMIITVDRTRPVLGGNGGALVFPAEVVADGVTGEYLESHGDSVDAQVPGYTAVRPGDEIHWYWDTTYEQDLLADERTLTLDDVATPILLPFTGDMIRARGDGTRMARYRVYDRAGNASDFSSYVSLETTANAPPREFAWPNIKDASGTAEQVTLEPRKVATAGATVIIPEAADLREDDEVSAQWAVAGSSGSHHADAPTAPGGREFHVPKDKVAFHIGRVVPVHYAVVDRKGREYVSATRQVRILAVPINDFPVVQCAGLSGNRTLSLAAVPAGGAALTLAPWMLIGTDQHITLRVEGLDAAGAATALTIIDKRRLTAAEVTDGIGKGGSVVIPKVFLTGLRMDFPFKVLVIVSFDLGQTWPPVPNFPRLDVTLVP